MDESRPDSYSFCMYFLRQMLVSALAAVAACPLGSLIFFQKINRFSFVALVFTLMGALILMLCNDALADRSVAVRIRYVVLLAFGLSLGGLMLAYPISGNGFLVGAGYGFITTCCWIAFDALAAKLFGGPRPRQGGY